MITRNKEEDSGNEAFKPTQISTKIPLNTRNDGRQRYFRPPEPKTIPEEGWPTKLRNPVGVSDYFTTTSRLLHAIPSQSSVF